MKKLLAEIILAILCGRDYRTLALAVINERFITTAQDLIADIFAYKKQYENENWIEKLVNDFVNKSGKYNKYKGLWFGCLNEKTIKNMSGNISTKEIRLEYGKRNIESLYLLLNNFENAQFQLKVFITKESETIELNEVESIIFMNMISAMKMTLQGGGWSEIGKVVEKPLLYVIFKLLSVSDNDFILLPDKIQKSGLVGNREIDAIILLKDEKHLTIELKLLVGNPEIGDEALARRVDLFLTEKLSDMMIEEAKNIGVKVIEFRQENALDEIYDFLCSKDINCSKPEGLSESILKDQIIEFIEQWNENTENIKVMKKLKELTK
ncbi:TPA: CfrBI family restriction endonuclease [bacterium]|nr:CfrBI family restriction endonuclease [bacterium]